MRIVSTSSMSAANPDLNDTWGPFEPPTPEAIDKARRVVASMSDNANEASEFLAMLGLDG